MSQDDGKGRTRRRFLATAFVGATVGALGNRRQIVGSIRRFSTLADDVGTFGALATGMPISDSTADGIDTDKNGETDVVVRRSRDPTRSSCGPVVHITSDGTSTVDYGFTIVKVTDRNLTLRDLSESATNYEYIAGADDTSAVPDEVWFVLDDGEREHYVLRTEVDPDHSTTEWRRRNVSPEISGIVADEGSGQEWKEFTYDADENDGKVVRIGMDLIDTFGADAAVKGVGVGRGTPTTGESVVDTYFANLQVAGEYVALPVQEE